MRNRKYIEDLIYRTFDELDPSGDNTAKYRELYSNMSDKEFEKHMKEFLKDDNENFILEVIEFKHSLTMDKCEKAAKVVGIPLYEYVYMPHLTMDKKRVIVSKEKCLVGKMNIKRTQQFLHKKNGLAISDEQRSSTTGQVVGDDKDARDSDIEATFMVALDMDAVPRELHGPRSDDRQMQAQMMQQIATQGYVQLDELESSPENKVALTTLNTYLLSMGMKSDILGDTYILPILKDEILNK